jgi:hypothetical protein
VTADRRIIQLPEWPVASAGAEQILGVAHSTSSRGHLSKCRRVAAVPWQMEQVPDLLLCGDRLRPGREVRRPMALAVPKLNADAVGVRAAVPGLDLDRGPLNVSRRNQLEPFTQPGALIQGDPSMCDLPSHVVAGHGRGHANRANCHATSDEEEDQREKPVQAGHAPAQLPRRNHQHKQSADQAYQPEYEGYALLKVQRAMFCRYAHKSIMHDYYDSIAKQCGG